ncbi:division/cell wall cluster transcriptional repressor MraZ [Falsirhodobacter sp. 20TX0035]|uniref:division/cell wall cluster transcriptional repressor MraZ n=1 Tax=Falsirhodobacter sp. 20TX0035 TaxID=3022019 RepID=UPI002330EBEE|nr:division/cell wall cluster transcriptional repressor MraZ [Falsirhodobacter sp. 20TX0035]MDB6452082.1 division/cell wall cluster transcriptional repressor MraZ [Falsirhodobacter sp. 20TX0035]
MSEAFRGEFNQKVDAKARVLIPVAFRRVLQDGDPLAKETNRPRIVMVYGDARRRFVECYTMAEMALLEQKILVLPAGSPQRRILERNYITLSATIEVDEDGRIVLPPKVRDKLGLSADAIKATVEAVFAGTLNTFQIWTRDAFDEELAAREEEELALLEGGVDMLTLLQG